MTGVFVSEKGFDIVMKFLFITAAPADNVFVAEAEKRNAGLASEFEFAGALRHQAHAGLIVNADFDNF